MVLDTKKLIFLILHLIFQVESNITSIDGTVGQETHIKFKFESLDNSRMDYKSLIVRKNETKIQCILLPNHFQDLPHEKHFNCYFYCNESSSGELYLYFPKLFKTDMGIYQLALFVEDKEIVVSNKVNLTVYPGPNITTELAPTFSSNNESRKINQSEITTKILILTSVVITPLFVLTGLLGWFYWTYNKKTDGTPAQSPSSQQRRCPVHNTVPAVSTIEYGVLDFPKQRTTNAEASNAQEGVEYATILYTPQRRRT